MGLAEHVFEPVRVDPGAERLDRLLAARARGMADDIGLFLRLAIGITVAVGEVHARGLIHKDIKPANILLDAATARVWLTGFGIASRLPRERQSPEPPGSIAGTFAYMAPEQTGRMNRSIDWRSDLYSLGVTLYEMLTGSLPFTASDPLEWVHCHIARQALPPADVSKDIPTPVSAVVMKLLAKAAEDRYQTAAGVERDLRRCLAAWEAQGRIEDFPLAERDIPDRLLIPEKLYGREREVEMLLRAFDDVVRSGAPELVLVSGYSGIGKSAVVSELHKVLVPPRGLFASGKFDQYKRDIPYSTLAQAFQGLIRRLLATSEAELQRWRDTLREALGLNGRLMIDLVPELKLVIGEQPRVPDLPPKDAQKRFHLVFRRFVSVFARREHPLALFLDDLQWVDAATLDFIEDLLTASDVEHLLLVGAYRDNEVTPADPLLAMLARLRRAEVPVREVVLAPLPRTHLGQFVADAMRSSPARVQELTDLVAEKTSGNPFFAIQFLTSLETDGLVRFNREQVAWQVDVAGARARNYTDNVVALMVTKLQRLSADAQEMAMLAACVGNVFAAEKLAVLRRRSEAEIHADLFELVREGLLARVGASYRFSHDRVQQAAYALIPEDRRSATHLNVGRLLLEHTPESHLAESVFDIVNQLNLGASLIADTRERMRTAELNLLAARRAKASAAYENAARYAQAGIQLLEDGGWAAAYRFAYDLHLELAQLEYLLGNRGRSQDLIATVLAHAQDKRDKAAAYEFLVDLYLTEAEINRALQTALDCISLFGIELKPHPTRAEVQNEYDALRRSLGDRQIEDLLDLPPMSSAETKAALGAMAASMVAAFYTDMNLLLQLSCQMVNLSLRHGNADASALGYVWLGATLGLVFGKYEEGYRFGKLARDYAQKHGLGMLKPRIDNVFGFSIHCWIKPLKAALPCLEEGLRSAVELGDLTVACYCAHHIVNLMIVQGSPLAAVYRESEARLDFLRRAHYAPIVDEIVAMQRLVQNMRGLTASFSTFDGATFDQRVFEEHLDRGVRPVTVSEYYIWKLAARFISGNVAEAIDASERVRALLWSTPGPLHAPEYHYYRALSLASAYRDASPAERRDRLQALREHEAQLREWANHCPENFASKSALVSAEVARIAGDHDEAMRLYERAIRSAAESGLVHNEAIAYELASRFWRARGNAVSADAYLWAARACYQRWGADGKVRQIEEAHPHLRSEQPSTDPRSTMDAPVEHLELATVLKIAHAVSGEIVLEKLIDSLMRMAIEHAGAKSGLLIVPGDHELRIQAEATTGTGSISVALRNARVSSADLPESVVQYAARTGEIVLLDDASARGAFTADEYVRRKHARSILCLPLVKQGRMVALLYLENDLIAGVFTPARISVLSVLASHAATSLENARLFTERKRAEESLLEMKERFRALAESSLVGVYLIEENRFRYVNPAMARMFGYTVEEVVDRLGPPDLVYPADRALVAGNIRRREEGNMEEIRYEFRGLRKDGSVFPVEVHGRRIVLGGRVGVMGALLDNTERKRAEHELRRSQSYLAEAQRLSHTGSFGWNASTGEIFWSDETYRIFELDRATPPTVELVVQRMHPDDRAAVLATIDLAQREGKDFDLEHRLLMPDGSVKHLHVVAQAMTDEAGRREFAGAVMDVTARKRAQEEREKLRQAEADLARISRATTLGEFTASLAHEIRQPVAAAITNAKTCIRWLARDRPDVPEARAAAARIVVDANRVADIVSRVRALYKNDAPREERVDVNDVVRETLALLRNEASRHSVSMRAELAPDLPATIGDRVQLQQVLVNLILNGLEATGAAPGVLRIESARGRKGELLVTVTDEGIGLPEGAADRIFDAFFTTKPQGTGMGLAISRSIVERHGGRLWATPAEPRGTSFHVSLPAADPMGQLL